MQRDAMVLEDAHLSITTTSSSSGGLSSSPRPPDSKQGAIIGERTSRPLNACGRGNHLVQGSGLYLKRVFKQL